MVPLSELCARLELPSELASVMELKGWTVGRLAMLEDAEDTAIPILRSIIEGDERFVGVDAADLRKLVGCCGLFTSLLAWLGDRNHRTPGRSLKLSYVMYVPRRPFRPKH